MRQQRARRALDSQNATHFARVLRTALGLMDLHPDFPVVEGHHQMTQEWSVVLPSKFNRRIEDGDLVFWRPGFTVWVAVWNNDKKETKQQRLASLKTEHARGAFAVQERQIGSTLFYTYRLAENSKDKRVPALYCYAFSDFSEVQMAIYFDSETDASIGESLCLTIKYESRKP